MPVKARIRDLAGISMSATPMAARATPAAEASGTAPLKRSSRCERDNVSRAETPVASSAGTNAAANVANSPSSAPLTSDHTGMESSCTDTTKKRSVMVCVMIFSIPRPITIPSSTPMTELTSPITSASLSTRAKICCRVTPRARSAPITGRR